MSGNFKFENKYCERVIQTSPWIKSDSKSNYIVCALCSHSKELTYSTIRRPGFIKTVLVCTHPDQGEFNIEDIKSTLRAEQPQPDQIVSFKGFCYKFNWPQNTK